ncbi:hypothetical protein [Spongiactinospora sp. TRM90649]|uniref:hypothetical protein n=1 Tax=Spongiactinospora sp. TRM90649 TaxID=3031114 RepID=UPI0023F9ADC3|nr:hypothetical protein [Spongiactinospora sp. TRM90649]MDF5751927.1 hypothetical protein [Spongiactinospora sp. TRM90649]
MAVLGAATVVGAGVVLSTGQGKPEVASPVGESATPNAKIIDKDQRVDVEGSAVGPLFEELRRAAERQASADAKQEDGP